MAKNYEVLKIDELSRADPVNGMVPFYRHTIMTTEGTRLRIDISPEDFTREKVAPILEAAAKNADAIRRL